MPLHVPFPEKIFDDPSEFETCQKQGCVGGSGRWWYQFGACFPDFLFLWKQRFCFNTVLVALTIVRGVACNLPISVHPAPNDHQHCG